MKILSKKLADILRPLLIGLALAGQSARCSPADALLDYKFKDELGRDVSINDFRGQAVAVTFFYSRCPVAEFCPRLAKNFQAVQQKMSAMTNGPLNWHLISVSFDPDDAPETLKRYGESYQYDPKHWNFLTGPREKIEALARAAGVQFSPEVGTINHNFRTLILDTTGRLQMVFPTSGDLSDQIVAELLKAAKTQPAGRAEKPGAVPAG